MPDQFANYRNIHLVYTGAGTQHGGDIKRLSELIGRETSMQARYVGGFTLEADSAEPVVDSVLRLARKTATRLVPS